MSIAEMQSCLARLYTDDSFRRLFDIDPAATLREYLLTEDESAAIRQVDRRMLGYFAGSLKRKRRERIQRAYPALFAMGKSAVERYYLRYCQLYRANANRGTADELSDFGAFMEESAAGAEDLPPYAVELARFERLCHLSQHAPAARGETRIGVEGVGQGRTATANMDARPYARDGVQVVVFEYNVPEIAERLRQSPHADAGEVTAGEYPVVFFTGADAPGRRMLSLSVAAKLVLDLCDGSRTVSEIVGEVEALFGAHDLKDEVVGSIDRLHSLGVVEV